MPNAFILNLEICYYRHLLGEFTDKKESMSNAKIKLSNNRSVDLQILEFLVEPQMCM